MNNKLMFAALAAAAAFSSTAVWADAECQAGSAYGDKPGCASPDQPPRASGWGYVPPGAVYQQQQVDPYGYRYGFPYGMPQIAQVLPQIAQVLPPLGERLWIDPSTGLQYRVHPRRGDRDGDGIPDWRDRFPDDPSRY